MALLNLLPTVVVPVASAVSWYIGNHSPAFLAAGFSAASPYVIAVAGYVTATHGMGR